MPTAPAPQSVARSRYWLAATVRLASLALLLYAGLMLARTILSLLLALAMSQAGTQMMGFNWGIALQPVLGDTITMAVAAVLYVKARSLAGLVFPTVGAHCAKCGYSRRGLVTNAPCPECGARSDPSGA